jgi:hypothetical protein
LGHYEKKDLAIVVSNSKNDEPKTGDTASSPYGRKEVRSAELKEGTGKSIPAKSGVVKESRHGARTPYTTAVQLNTPGGPVISTTRNLSIGGLFVETNTPLSVGQKFEMRFKFRSGQHSIKLRAQVVRKTSEGFGLKLL